MAMINNECDLYRQNIIKTLTEAIKQILENTRGSGNNSNKNWALIRVSDDSIGQIDAYTEIVKINANKST